MADKKDDQIKDDDAGNPGDQAVIEKETPPVIAGDDGIEELKKQLAAERAARAKDQEARADAERRAFEASKTAFTAKNEVQASNLQMVTAAIDTMKGNQEQLKNALANAHAAQDYAAIAEIQVMITDNSTKLRELETGQEAIKNAPKPAPPRVQDPVEALAMQLTPRSANWVRAHPEYARNPALYQKMLAAHNLAVGDGIEPDTDEYFEEVERTLKVPSRHTRAEVDTDDQSAFSSAAAPAKARTSPAAAPVSRGTSSSNSSSGGRTITLSAAQAEAAAASGLTPKEYWDNMQFLKREGRVN